MTIRRTTWSEWLAPSLRGGPTYRVLWFLVPALLALAVLAAPIPTLVLVAVTALFVLLWNRPGTLVVMLVAVMGNVKVNYYAGFFTIFPEYIPIALAALVWALRWAEEPRRIEEPRLMGVFAALVAAGVLSSMNAVSVGRVLAKSTLVGVALVTFYLAFSGVRTRAELGRALRWFEGAAFVVAAYGIVQMIGGLMGFDTSLSFLERYSNPDMYLGIGAPVILRLTKFFRANSFFNDPNILGGYLAGATSLVLALRLHHVGNPAKRWRARFEDLALLTMGVCQLLTLSRSGFLATAVGAGIVLVFLPDVLRRARFWIGLVIGTVVAGIASAAAGIDPLLLVIRLSQSFDNADLSSRVHRDVFFYALSLLGRFPLTGVGLGNFGAYYGAEQDAFARNMMSHNAALSYLAEGGVLGGACFLVLVFAIARRPWRALRDPALRARAPELHAWIVGLFASLIAVDLANVFYDYYLRTFVWAISALALAAARLWERERADPGAPAP